jgi:hypothetical protein
MLSMGVLNSTRGCKKQEVKHVSVAPTPDRCRLQLLCDCCRWWWAEEVEEAEVGPEARGRCALGTGGGNRGDDLDRLGDAQVGGCESWVCAEGPRLGIWVAEEVGPVVRIRAGESELCQVGNIDVEGRGEREANTTGWGGSRMR